MKIEIQEISLFPGDVLIFNRDRYTYVGMDISFFPSDGRMGIYYTFYRSTRVRGRISFGEGYAVDYLGHEKRPLLEKYCEENCLDMEQVIAEGNPVVTTSLSRFRPDILFNSPPYPRMPVD